MIRLTVNGEPREVPAGTTVAGLVELLGVDARQVAVERNGVLVRRADHAATELAAADAVEVVTLVGGG